MGKISFNPRWKEELVATSDEGILIFEITMGKLHVYFPDETLWAAQAPAWAKGKWEEYKTAAEHWSAANNIPMSVVGKGWMYEEKKK